MFIKVFKGDLGAIRALRDESGEPWFVANDICKILGYSNPRDAVAKHIDDEDKRVSQIATPSGTQKTIVINESGLFSLVLRSNKPEAKKFKRWVTAEVLPAIRRYGGYLTPDKIKEIIANPDTIIELATQLKNLQEKVTILTHTKKLYTATEIAKELGFRSAIELNKKLEELGIQYKVNGTWVLKADYADLGYVNIKQEVKDNGKVIYHRKWTQLGREFLLDLFNSQNKAS
jgi:prophage antirepressor-like protein